MFRVILIAFLLIPINSFLNLSYAGNERWNHAADFSFGLGSGKGVFSVSWEAKYGFFQDKKLKAGFGPRFSGFWGGSEIPYTTAQADLIRDQLINTFDLSAVKTYSFNLAFHIDYTPFERFKFGFNIDLIGFGFGSSFQGNYHSIDNSLAGYQTGKASSWNLLLGGKPDRGQLNSEFFVAYEVNPSLWVKLGLTHFISEVTSDRLLDFGNDRFRVSSTLVFLGVTQVLEF